MDVRPPLAIDGTFLNIKIEGLIFWMLTCLANESREFFSRRVLDKEYLETSILECPILAKQRHDFF